MCEKSDWKIYSAYRLKIASAVSLPDLPASGGDPDVRIIFGKLSDDFLAENLGPAVLYERRGCRIQTSAQAMLIDWERVGKFFVSGGSQVIVEKADEAGDEELQPFLIGPILSILLHQRGNLVLHASAVNVKGKAAIFLGAKGEGKSTLAAYLQTCGHALISDDIVPVGFGRNRAQTSTGYPKIKLFADAVGAVGASTENLPLIHPLASKYSFDSSENFAVSAEIPIGAIFVLTANDETRIERCDLKSAFIELTRHSYLNRFLKALHNRRDHFEHCRKLVQTVPIFQLKRRCEFEHLPAVNLLVENQLSDA